MTTLNDIDRAAQKHADAREILTALVGDLTALQEALAREHMPKIRRAVAKAAESHDALKALIESAPDLFAKPKSQTMHGLKLGYRKGTGRMEFEYEDAETVARIKKLLGDRAELYINTTEKPNKTELAELDSSTLRKLGVAIEAAGEMAFVKPVDGAVDKIVKALVKEATED